MAKPRVEWNPDAARYAVRLPGKYSFISESAIRDIVDDSIEVAGLRMRKHGTTLRTAALRYKAGHLTKDEYEAAVMRWRDVMAADVKAEHAKKGAEAVGGFANMRQADHGRVGGLLRVQYRYLENAAAQYLENPDVVLGVDGRPGVEDRSASYAEAARYTYERMADLNALDAGLKWVYNELEESAHHCYSKNGQQAYESCPGQTDLGAVRMDDPKRIPPGRRICKNRCKCKSRRFKTKKAATAARRETKSLDWGWHDESNGIAAIQ